MVAFSGGDPIGVLIGAKRSSSTLIHTIAVHPDHQRRGHGGHLLASLSSKLAILGPPRLVAEVPEVLASARRLFTAGGYVEEARLTDYVAAGKSVSAGRATEAPPGSAAIAGGFIVPVTVDDLVANDLLADAHHLSCWERSLESLTARKSDIAGLAVASDERIEAFVLYAMCGNDTAEILSLRSLIEGGMQLQQLLTRLRHRGIERFTFPRVHPAEMPNDVLETLGFTPAASYLRYSATARSQ